MCNLHDRHMPVQYQPISVTECDWHWFAETNKKHSIGSRIHEPNAIPGRGRYTTRRRLTRAVPDCINTALLILARHDEEHVRGIIQDRQCEGDSLFGGFGTVFNVGNNICCVLNLLMTGEEGTGVSIRPHSQKKNVEHGNPISLGKYLKIQGVSEHKAGCWVSLFRSHFWGFYGLYNVMNVSRRDFRLVLREFGQEARWKRTADSTLHNCCPDASEERSVHP